MSVVGVARLALALVAVAPAIPGPAIASAEVRPSGTITEVAQDGSGMVLDEIVTWTGPDTGRVRRSVRVTPATSIRLVIRTDRWDDDRTSRPGWDARVVDAGQLRAGDFVTVTTDDDRRDVAVAMQIVRPGSR
jgi:hypothetical protein